MVSFVCNYCQETIKKPKLDQHFGRCPAASFSCIDCSTDFQGTSYRAHTSCVSEAQKYQGKLYKPPTKKAASAPATPSITEELKKRKAPEEAKPEPAKKEKKAEEDLSTTLQTLATSILKKEGKEMSLKSLKKKTVKKAAKESSAKGMDKADIEAAFDDNVKLTWCATGPCLKSCA